MRSPRAAYPFVSLALLANVACSGTGPSPSSTAPASPVSAASPPKDDGQAAQGGTGGTSHAAALEQLKVAPLRGRIDKQQAVRVLLPDAEHWTRVRFWGVPSLVGFRYGKEHHAIVGGVVTHVADNTAQGACTKSFEAWAMPWVQSFEVELTHEAPSAFVWTHTKGPSVAKGAARQIVEIDAMFAKTATLAEREAYAVAYSAYPAWAGACLILGVAVPARDDPARARDVRDRFARDVLPKVEVLSENEPKETY
ncbi:hypothetical protein [Pendulispora albinea]|uniref:Uncharacterized protein n=1 Tax=Pendulispora albinea TaxID=2741071 RepID=A0ABZ2LP24_9BACT